MDNCPIDLGASAWHDGKVPGPGKMFLCAVAICYSITLYACKMVHNTLQD